MLAGIQAEYGDPARVRVALPDGPAGVHHVRVYRLDAVHSNAFDSHYFDAGDGSLLRLVAHEDLSRGGKVRRAVYSWHIGEVGGVATQSLWALVSLLGATLPITGFLMWYRRRRRPRQSR